MTPHIYSSEFYLLHQERSITSAEEIIPIVKKYIQPDSVIDVGCGNGTWLKVWKSFGVKNIVGIDGAYVNPDQLLIDKKEFVPFDLESGYLSDEKFDLVTSLEVGEHIASKHALRYVDSLCRLGNIILFSAALPGQPGTNHINAQYPEYWVNLFAMHNYVAVDCLRSQIWENPKIEWWYRQNIFFVVNASYLNDLKELNDAYYKAGGKVCSYIHPELFEHHNKLVTHYRSLVYNPFRLLKRLVKKYF
jgi:SAM-dependent methyltransferase